MKKIVISPQFQNYEIELLKIITNFPKEGYILGNQKRNEIRVVDFKDAHLNIKSFKKPGIINRIVYGYFRKSKAKRSFKYASLLQQKGIGTPKPIAFIENKNILGLTNSYYISEHIDANLTYRELVKQSDFPEHEVILRKFVHFTHSLHENNILFNDHSPGNTLIKKIENDYHFYLVDLNRMSFKELNFQERMKNFARLTPKKEMVEIMSSEYAMLTGINFNTVYNEMWKHTSNFQAKYLRKKQLKKKLKFYKK